MDALLALGVSEDFPLVCHLPQEGARILDAEVEAVAGVRQQPRNREDLGPRVRVVRIQPITRWHFWMDPLLGSFPFLLFARIRTICKK